MKRKCEKIAESQTGEKISIYIDSLNKSEISAYIKRDERHLRKWEYIARNILEGHWKKEIYCSVEINRNCKNVTEMRFFVGQENDRIYCKEIKTSEGVKIIVASILHERKKTNKLSSKEKSAINKVGGYDYEI